MALFYPAVVLAGGWVLGSYVWNLKRTAVTPPSSAQSSQPTPHYGAITHISKWSQADKRQFVSVEEDVDEVGATIFLVDYGTGSKTIQYSDPRILE